MGVPHKGETSVYETSRAEAWDERLSAARFTKVHGPEALEARSHGLIWVA